MRIPPEAYEATLEFEAPAVGRADALEAVAQLLEQQLASFGFQVMGIDRERDEEITWVELANVSPFVVQIGLTKHPQAPRRLLAFIYPPLPFVRIWFRKVSTVEIVGRLEGAVRSILQEFGGCTDLHWLTEADVRALWRSGASPR